MVDDKEPIAVSALECISRDGLTAGFQDELHQKFESTSQDVEELLEGQDATLISGDHCGAFGSVTPPRQFLCPRPSQTLLI